MVGSRWMMRPNGCLRADKNCLFAVFFRLLSPNCMPVCVKTAPSAWRSACLTFCGPVEWRNVFASTTAVSIAAGPHDSWLFHHLRRSHPLTVSLYQTDRI